MAKLGEDPKRLGIFFFFDAQGVVDSYVETLLADMVKNLSELTVVVNGELTAKSYAKLSAFTDNIILRENKGLDVWAYKTAMESHGWERLSEFDEVVLFNATIMGPVYPFKEMFTEMARRNIDFWGITWFHEVPFDPFGYAEEDYLPRHLQSHFHAYRRSLVTSKAFQDYWDEMPEINGYEQSVGMHEVPFTQRFERLGFISDVYVNTEDMEGFNFSPILFAPVEVIRDKRCPIFKRRSFFRPYDDVLRQSVGQPSAELYAYLRDHTDFDVNLIWDNALRSMNMADLVKNLQLTYVLPTQTVTREPKQQKVALIAHLYYMDLVEPTLEYIRNMPEGIDIFLSTSSPEKVEQVKVACQGLPYNIEVRLVENRGRDVGPFLVGWKDVVQNYDVVCYTHDKKVTQLSPYSVGDGFAYKCFENLLPTRDFVKNVIATFDAEPRLGFLTPTPPNHADYFPVYTLGWGPNFDRTEALLHELGINVPLDPDKEPVAPLGSMFWFRPKALKPLFDHDWQWEEFPPEPCDIDGTILHAIERAHAYVAQGAGYYCGWLFSDSFARIELTNLSFYVRDLTYAIADRWGRATETQMVQMIQAPPTTRQWLKGRLNRWVPSAFQPALKGSARRVYRKLRGA